MKRLCGSLRKHAMEIINFKKKKKINTKHDESYENAKISFISKEKFEDKYAKV